MHVILTRSRWAWRPVVLISVSTLFVVVVIWLFIPFSKAPYPCQNPEKATIADFAGTAGMPAQTCLGSPWSMFSDNGFSMKSVVNFTRLNEEAPDGTSHGFMRLSFQLDPSDNREPFVAVFADLSFPPPKSFDLSKYPIFHLRLRLGQPSTQAPITVHVILYSSNIRGPSYVFPRISIPYHQLSDTWRDIDRPLSSFVYPNGQADGIPLDKSKIYRVGVMITGPPNKEIHGHVDLTDLFFLS